MRQGSQDRTCCKAAPLPSLRMCISTLLRSTWIGRILGALLGAAALLWGFPASRIVRHPNPFFMVTGQVCRWGDTKDQGTSQLP